MMFKVRCPLCLNELPLRLLCGPDGLENGFEMDCCTNPECGAEIVVKWSVELTIEYSLVDFKLLEVIPCQR